MKTTWIAVLAVVLVLGAGVYWYQLPRGLQEDLHAILGGDYKNTTYSIEGKTVKLSDGVAEEAVPGSSTKIVTRVFGNELKKDLNHDGIDDVIFLLTQNTGGSGTFYYAVVAVSKGANGFIGSDGYLLGDRIAPQTTESGKGDIVIVNYAERKPGEPFTTQPSVGKSVWLKLDLPTMRWGIVQPNFEGESR